MIAEMRSLVCAINSICPTGADVRQLGHTQVQTTARYAHLANESVKASGSRIADSIGADILSGEVQTEN